MSVNPNEHRDDDVPGATAAEGPEPAQVPPENAMMAGILSGTVVIELDPAQVEDEVGSDRFGRWEKDADFARLVQNIRRRGQKQPIRVRPVSDGWMPETTRLSGTDARFYIQSGRRRLAVCRQLDRAVLAVVSTPEGDARLADLEERFHENTMRENLSPFEELISIGTLARGMQQLTQTEIAERLGVVQGDVSLGLDCYEFQNEIAKQIDIHTVPKRRYRAMIPKLKRGETIGSLIPTQWAYDAAVPYDVRGIRMSAKKISNGFEVKIRRAAVSENEVEAMMVELAKVVMKHQIKRKG